MKAMQMLKVSLVVLFLVGGLIGCASTPAPSPEEAHVGHSDMSQQGEAATASGSGSGSQGGDAPMHEHMAGMENIYFDFDQFTLSADARKTLSANADYLKANSGVQIVIEGHCDERGSDEYNLALGESRALAAKDYLASLGISAKRVSVISYGEEKPAAMGANEAAWSKNRRAEFKAVR